MKLVAILAIVCLASAVAAGASKIDDALIEQFLRSGRPELTSCAARRVLTASTMGGRLRARLEVWTYLDRDGTFRFDVIRGDGSRLLLEHVLIAALETERRSRDPRVMAEVALTPANYDFDVAGPASDGLVNIRLIPRRRSPMLLEGLVVVRQDNGDVVRVEGRPSEPPSSWTTRVDIIRRYERIGGVRVPVEMVSEAQVRLAGASSFSMTYHYTIINGQAVR
ncbi:MAG: hypothetical protein HYY76_09905 [Acidobacteria bacterium]|nr:hypothetical protein [Acidobacteriota bacterium]